jgi:hypothetical protein
MMLAAAILLIINYPESRRYYLIAGALSLFGFILNIVYYARSQRK